MPQKANPLSNRSVGLLFMGFAISTFKQLYLPIILIPSSLTASDSSAIFLQYTASHLPSIHHLLFTMLRQEQETPPDLAYSDFVIAVEDGQIEKITIEEGSISGVQIDGREFTTYAPTISQDLLALLKDKQVTVKAQPKDEGGF